MPADVVGSVPVDEQFIAAAKLTFDGTRGGNPGNIAAMNCDRAIQQTRLSGRVMHAS
jgi:hypothetical protein